MVETRELNREIMYDTLEYPQGGLSSRRCHNKVYVSAYVKVHERHPPQHEPHSPSHLVHPLDSNATA
jgi:hypothetical protein